MSGHCGYVAIAGRPNVGKSTLLNHLLGQKLSITSRKPQTTRHTLLGIKTEGENQIIYVDTPGLQAQPQRALNRYMNRVAQGVLGQVDVMLFMVEALQWRDEDTHVLKLLQAQQVPILLLVNKIDKVKEREQLLPYLQKIAKQHDFLEVIPLSANRGDNLAELEQRLISLLPEGPPLFPDDYITDRSERFLASEMVREKLMRRLGAELPYRLSVEIEHFSEEEEGRLHIAAVIWVEKPSQKAIVIGKGGRLLKAVGTEARLDMENLFECKVFLQLWVKIKSGWSDDERTLKRFGYTE